MFRDSKISFHFPPPSPPLFLWAKIWKTSTTIIYQNDELFFTVFPDSVNRSIIGISACVWSAIFYLYFTRNPIVFQRQSRFGQLFSTNRSCKCEPNATPSATMTRNNRGVFLISIAEQLRFIYLVGRLPKTHESAPLKLRRPRFHADTGAPVKLRSRPLPLMRFSLFLDKSDLHNSTSRRTSARRVLAYGVRMAQESGRGRIALVYNEREKVIAKIAATKFVKKIELNNADDTCVAWRFEICI